MASVTSKDGSQIAYERNGHGPALIMIDAAGGYHGFRPMAELANILTSNFTVYTYDRRGRGNSTDTQPYAVEREIEDLEALILQAGGSADVFGFSSGAVLAIHAAARGLPINKLALLEPPIEVSELPTPVSSMEKEIGELVKAGRNEDAFTAFHIGIGVPDEIVNGMKQAPFWKGAAAYAPTLIYDMTINRTLTPEQVARVKTPSIVLNSEGSDERLQSWAKHMAAALPYAVHRSLKGEWHGIPAADLAPVITQFFTGA